MLVKVTCDNCGIIFERQEVEIKRRKHRFCSSSCSATYSNKKRGTKRYCEVCGNLI